MKKKTKKVIKPGRGRKCMGSGHKKSILFTVDPGVLAEFKRHAKDMKLNMSSWVQEKMHLFNVEHAMEYL